MGNLSQSRKDRRWIINGYLLVTIAIIVFSTIEVVSQHVQREENVSVFDLSLLRFGIGGLVLIISAFIRFGKGEMFRIIKTDGWRIALLGLIGTTGLSLVYHRSLMLTSSMIGGAIFSINPAIVAMIFLISRVEKPNWSKILGVLLGIACVYVTNKGAKSHEPEFPNYFVGNIFMILAVLAWSFYFFLVRDYIKKYSALIVSSIAVVGGSIGLVVTVPLIPLLGWGDTLTFYKVLSPMGWVLVLYLGIVTVGLGYFWLYMGLARTGVSKGMMIFFIKPALVAILAHFLQNQPLSPWIWLGIVLASASIIIVGINDVRSR
ncbi:TPA: DMT family transporter [Candidatus Poribacteria bacterium]|nr:DMT family transporter [Candidatus Poribacteria bacterium]